MPKFASIDVGSNTVRLLVANALGSTAYNPLYQEQEITRLGEGFLMKGYLDSKAMERTANTIDRFCRIARDFQVQEIYAASTGVVREARNREEFRSMVREKAGIELAIISEEEEGRLSLLGVHASLGRPSGRFLLVDIGGGSTELILAHGPLPELIKSLPLGVVKLTEDYLRSNPPNPSELGALTRFVRHELSWTREGLEGLEGLPLVGTAGTPTTLAAIDMEMRVYDPMRVNGYVLKMERLEEILSLLISLSLEDRRCLPGLEPGRADVIIPGTIIVLEIMRKYGFQQIMVSDGGLREGLLLDLLARMGSLPGKRFDRGEGMG